MAQELSWVLLLKAPSKTDKAYVEAATANHLRSVTVSPLAFSFSNEERLLAALRHPQQQSALITTSPRGVDAIVRQFKRLSGAEAAVARRLPLFVVGKASARTARDGGLLLHSEEKKDNPNENFAGNAAELAASIVQDVDKGRLQVTTASPLLLVVGNKRLPDLPDALQRADIPFTELEAYSSHASQSVWGDAQRAAADIGLCDQTSASLLLPPAWIVVFSPSGIKALERVLDGLSTSNSRDPPRRPSIAALGQTTARALRAAGYTVDAEAQQPSAAGVFRAIAGTDSGIKKADGHL